LIALFFWLIYPVKGDCITLAPSASAISTVLSKEKNHQLLLPLQEQQIQYSVLYFFIESDNHNGKGIHRFAFSYI
jgi:hypothetical protein